MMETRWKRILAIVLTVTLFVTMTGVLTCIITGDRVYAAESGNIPDVCEQAAYQEASWTNGVVTYSNKTADNCTPVTDSTEAVTWDESWYVVNGIVTIDQPITVNGDVNLILVDGCTLNAKQGIVVTENNSLTIYAQVGDTGTLNATGVASSGNASAGIGGGTEIFDSGNITIHGGTITATGGGTDNIGIGGAGIGGGTNASGDGGSSGAITIYGGTVTANSGAGNNTGAGIGGGAGGTGNGGVGSNITISGGSVNATGGSIGAGIGGGGGSSGSGTGTGITISGGEVTAVGGKYAAGIGGGGGYIFIGSYSTTTVTGGTGTSISITGGIVDAKGGDGNSSGNYAGDPIGNGGNASDDADVEKTAGIIFENGAGRVYGAATLDKDYSLPADYSLIILAGASLSGSGKLSGGGNFQTENVTADMISGTEGLAYTGTDYTDQIKLEGKVTLCGVEFTADTTGWTIRIEPAEVKAAGNYMVTLTKEGSTPITKTFTVAECSHTGLVYTPQAINKHGGTCTICNTEVSEEHTWVDGTCEVCNSKAVAKVEIGNATTYYGEIGPAWTAAKGHTATVTLLANVTASYMMVAGGDDITFDGGEFTLTGPSNNNKFIDITGGKLTVTGGTLKTGENTSGHLSADIIISGGELVVTGGSLEAGTDCVGLSVMGNAPVVKLSGGTFHGIGMNTDTVGRLLMNYGSTNATDKHYAYYQGDEPVDLTKLEKQYVLTDTVTVQECEHEGVTPTANSDGTHTLKCPYCGYTGPEEDCSYGTEYQHDDTNHWLTCEVCQGTTTPEAHYLRVTADEPVNGVTQNREACDYCDFTKNPFTVTVTVPSGLTYGNTVGIKPSYTVGTEKTFDVVRLALEDGEGNVEYMTGDTLPDDLSAGNYKLYLNGVVSGNPLPVFLGRAYFTVAPAQLTGDMVKLSPESVTYSGAEQKPTITVKQGETTLKEGTDYDVTYSTNDFTNAGTITVTITGKGNYTGTVEKTYTIKKAPLTITASSQTITYGGSITQGADNVSDAGLCSGDRLDGITLTAGTANVPGGNITPSAAGIKNSGGKDVTGNYEITYKDGGLTINKADAEITVGTGTYSKTFGDAAFTLDVTDNNTEADMQYEVTEGTDVVSVSNGTVTIQNAGTATITVSLPETANYNAAESKTITVSVAKKGGYTVAEQNRSYLYSRENTGSIDLAALLPKDCGAVTYGTPAASGDVTYSVAPDVNDGKLSYTLNSGNINDEGTITVTVAMRNYTDITITVKVKLTDQIPVSLKTGTEVTLKDNVLTYGETLSKLIFNEAEFVGDDGNTVAGTLTWKDVATTPNAGTASAVWVFTPADTAYVEVEGTAAITVNKAAPTVSETPAVADRVYNPSRVLEQGDLSGITVTGMDGNTLKGGWNWKDSNIVPTVNNSGYVAVFTPTDATNYETVTSTVTVNVTKATPYIAELPTAAGITYGDTLNVSALSGGTVQYGNGTGQAGSGAGSTETVAGIFTWKESSTRPAVADSGKTEYTVVFTPSDTINYETTECSVTLTVQKAVNAPNMPGSTMDVPNSCERVSDVALPENWEWKASDQDTVLEVGKEVNAVAVYTGADKGSYEKETVTITITRASCDHVAGEILYTGEGEKASACEIDGLGHRECTKCGSVIETGIVIPALKHNYTDKVTKEPTTEREGIRTYTCSRCGNQYTESIPKLPEEETHQHSYKESVTKEPTCTEDGLADKKCSTCGFVAETGIVIPALGHDYKNEVTKEPTTEREGIRTYTCSRCGNEYTESIPKLPEETHQHSYTESVTKEPTCTDTGIRTYTCSCGDSYTETIAAPGHHYLGRETKKPTTTEEGVMTYTCDHCGDTYTESIPKLPGTPSGNTSNQENKIPVKGEVISDAKSKAVYTVTQAGKTGGTVSYTKSADNKATSISVPNTVVLNGISYKVTAIAQNAFKNNKKLTKVTIGNNITAIGNNAFYGCKKLKNVSMGTNVTTIGTKSFYKCTSLTKITIPAKVSRIGKQAFYGCKKLKTITIKTKKLTGKKVGSKAFKGIHSKATVKVPKSKLKIYKQMLKAKGIGSKVKVKK